MSNRNKNIVGDLYYTNGDKSKYRETPVTKQQDQYESERNNILMSQRTRMLDQETNVN